MTVLSHPWIVTPAQCRQIRLTRKKNRLQTAWTSAAQQRVSAVTISGVFVLQASQTLTTGPAHHPMLKETHSSTSPLDIAVM